jgi:hypothetical protein
MRKIYITENQLQYCISEAMNQGAGVQVAAETDGAGRVTNQTLYKQNQKLNSQGLDNAQIVVDQDTINETTYTKKQLKEARLRKLMKESKKKFTKGELKSRKN